MSRKLDETNNNEVEVDLQKREFMSKFGKYAALGAGMATLMTPTLSTAKSYENNGFGNGDDDSPGGSCENNNAENAGCLP